MAALNPIASKSLSGRLGSMQMLLLTAMTLLGFYLCFKEIRRVSVEMASLRDQVTEDVAAAAGAAAQAARRAAPAVAPAPAPGMPGPGPGPARADDEEVDGMVMVMEDDLGMDEGLRMMLQQLQGAVPLAPVADIEEIEAEGEAEGDTEAEAEAEAAKEAEAATEAPAEPPAAHAARTKADLEALLREGGVPFKKSDPKARLVELLAQAEAE